MGEKRVKHALITGGGTGIGAAIAVEMARSGINVTITGRRSEPLEEMSRCHDLIHWVAGDVRDEKNVAKMFASAREHCGSIDMVVANAGIAGAAPLAKTSLEMWNDMMAVNLTGVFLTMREAQNDMKQNGWGRMIAVASTAGLKGSAYISAYAATKHGVVGLVRSIAMEMAGTGITANCVCPGFTQTAILETSIANIMEKYRKIPRGSPAHFGGYQPHGQGDTARGSGERGDVAGWRQFRRYNRTGNIRQRRRNMVVEILKTKTGTSTSKSRLRMWIAILRSTRSIETEIRERLRREYDVTLPRFDVMAALWRKPRGMMMSQLSRYLMVSNGNVTGIVDRLVKDGLVIRSQRDGDRRSWIICLTTSGTTAFEAMAKAHEQWINELLADYDLQDAEQIYASFSKLNTGQVTAHG